MMLSVQLFENKYNIYEKNIFNVTY